MDVVILIAFIAAVSGAWWRLTEHAKAAGTGWYLRNVFAGTVAILIGGLGAGLMSEGGFVSLFGVAIVIYAASSPWMRVEGNKVRWEARLWRPEDTQAPHAVSNIDAAVERPLNQETDRIRRESLAAMKQAAKARQADMARRGEEPAKPLWMENYSPSMTIDDDDLAADDTAARAGAGFETITFDYVDSHGERSHRTVEVTAVDDEYLEGFCHKAQAERTFVIGRIRGKVMVDDTAEVMAPKKWAAEARRNPHNGVVAMGGDTPKRYLPKDDPVDGLDEILFTGFPAAKRAELEALAAGAGMRVVKTVTVDLMYLCMGPNAGPSKIDKANEVGAALIDEAQFLSLI